MDSLTWHPMWDDLPEASHPDLAPLRPLSVDDDDAIAAHYSAKARQIAPTKAPEVVIAAAPATELGGGAGYIPVEHRIELDPRESVTAADIASGRWRGFLEGQFWHEIAHALTKPTREPDLTEELLAYQLLEDVRIERALLETHPEARPWLRTNTLGRSQTAKSILTSAGTLGWLVIYGVFGARRHAGVVTDEEASEIEELAPSVARPQLVDIDGLFAEYATNGVSSARRARIITAVAQKLPARTLFP